MAEPERPTFTTSEELAFARTSLAHDRTLLAWVRTSIGIIGFGFTFYKFFEYLEPHKGAAERRIITARDWAMFLIFSGSATLLLAALQHLRSMRELEREYPQIKRSRVPLLALSMSIFGFMILLAVIFRF